MSDTLIDRLAGELRPVRRLPPPSLRAAIWLVVVAAGAAALAAFADLPALRERLAMVPDMWLAVIGSTLTAAGAAIAAFLVSIPGRDGRWAGLPLPPLALWVGASGLGCLRGAAVPGQHAVTGDTTMVCLSFILAVSLPLSVLMLAMLRMAAPLRPGLVAVLAGLAASAAAATLLNFFHPYDASAVDLAVHVAAVGAVIGLNRAVGGRLLG